MKYTIKKLAELAGITTRTLRYYDSIDLLKPNEINQSNYRIYDEKNVDKLQQIMFYRSLEFPLSQIKQILDDPDFSTLKALEQQRQLLLNKQAELAKLLTNIDQTIKSHNGEITMTDTEKFAAFKQQRLKNNETEFGAELTEKYDSETIKKANQKFGNLTEADYQQMQTVERTLIDDLVELRKQPDLDSPLAEKIYQEHKQWLSYTWPKYTVQAHQGLVEMYLADERFKQYYDKKAGVPVTQLLHDVVLKYAK